MSPKNKPQKVLTLKKLLKVVNPIKKSAPDSYPTGKPKYPNTYSKLSTMKPSPQKKVVKKAKIKEVVYFSLEFKTNELLTQFLQWQMENKIYRALRQGSCGMGYYKGFYTKEDAKKIKKYLGIVTLPPVNKKSGK